MVLNTVVLFFKMGNSLPASIVSPNRGSGRTEFFVAHGPVPNLWQTSTSRLIRPNPSDPYPLRTSSNLSSVFAPFLTLSHSLEVGTPWLHVVSARDELSEQIGHEPWISIVMDRFTGPESLKHTIFVTLRDHLCSSGGTRIGDHVPRKPIHPQQQLNVSFKRSRY